jgi:uroporphyrinogen-III synthase
MRFLVTRPREDAETIAARLQERGHEAVLAPLMEVQLYPGEELTLDGVQAILATSANGVRAIANRTARRDIPVYGVGPQTAEVARGFGFRTVHSAGGDSATLTETVAAQLAPEAGSLFHAAGTETAGRLRQALEARDYTVESTVLYEATAATALPEEASAALRSDVLDGVMLFSPRSAKILVQLVGDAGLAEHCARLDAYCISAATAEALGTAFARALIAGAPNQDAMLALIPEAATGASFLGHGTRPL